MINLDLDPSQIEIYSVKKDKRKDFEKISAQEYNDKIEKYVRRTSMMPAARNGNVNANPGRPVLQLFQYGEGFPGPHLPHAQAG